MLHKNGGVVIKCSMAVDGIGFCSTCIFNRNWVNSRKIKEGEPGYCDNPDVTTADSLPHGAVNA